MQQQSPITSPVHASLFTEPSAYPWPWQKILHTSSLASTGIVPLEKLIKSKKEIDITAYLILNSPNL